MSDASPPVSLHFDAARAEVYDDQFPAMRPIMQAAHLLVQTSFTGLPDDARILMAGAGTGAEARFLAARFPGWQFTLIDPSAPMLAVARRHAEAEGFADRCTFHADYVSETPVEPHDAATSLLVSHFLTEAPARQAFFGDIAARLKPGGRLFNLDLCADRDDPRFSQVMDLWLALMAQSGIGEEMRANYVRMFGSAVAVHGPSELEALIEAAGFTLPAPVYQGLLIRGWTASKA